VVAVAVAAVIIIIVIITRTETKVLLVTSGMAYAEGGSQTNRGTGCAGSSTVGGHGSRTIEPDVSHTPLTTVSAFIHFLLSL